MLSYLFDFHNVCFLYYVCKGKKILHINMYYMKIFMVLLKL